VLDCRCAGAVAGRSLTEVLLLEEELEEDACPGKVPGASSMAVAAASITPRMVQLQLN
jgi:hypothetical protein